MTAADAPPNEIGLAPPEGRDEKRGERRHDQRSDTDPADREARGETPTPGKPSLNRTQRGNVGEADTESDPDSISYVHFDQGAGETGSDQARSGQDHAGNGQTAGAPPIGQRTADDPERSWLMPDRTYGWRALVCEPAARSP
jgi:hypothetical protein